jgi:uncharacterized protein with von Willebrand factor type A (vWA) domain
MFVASWQYFADKKRLQLFSSLLIDLLNYMNEMSKMLGYSDLYQFFRSIESDKHANIAMTNIQNAFISLNREFEIPRYLEKYI